MFGNLGGWVADVLAASGSLGLAFLLLLENLFPPIPSEVILPLAGFLIWRGDLGAPQALVAATAGSLLGAYALYAIGRWGGRPLVLRFGRVLRVTERDLDRAEGWFDRYGSVVVFVARMMPGARSIVSIPAGMLHMPLARFTLLTALGSAVWNALLLTAGYALGDNWSRVSDVVGPLSNAIVLVILISAAVLIVWWVYFRKREKRRKRKRRGE
ncbi:MAG TPA: DedA family protein [Rubrobacteraceae bacterium]|nr:DedA family protein [Rubrobacteraceae bacterium]